MHSKKNSLDWSFVDEIENPTPNVFENHFLVAPKTLGVLALNCSPSCDSTDKNIFDDSYLLVTPIPDFLIWENRMAYFK